MIFSINSTRGQMRFLTCVARVTCLVSVIVDYFENVGGSMKYIMFLISSYIKFYFILLKAC